MNYRNPMSHHFSSSSPQVVPANYVSSSTHVMGVSSALSNANQSMSQSGQMQQQTLCCLFEDGHRCTRVAGTATFSKRIEKQVAQRKMRLSVDHRTGHSFICEHHRLLIQSMRTSGKRKRKDSEDDNSNDVESDSHHHLADIDLFSLQVNTLRRYKKHYRIQTRPGLNKTQLAETLMRHFKSIPVYEKEAITYFIYMVKTNKNKLDNLKGGSSMMPID